MAYPTSPGLGFRKLHPVSFGKGISPQGCPGLPAPPPMEMVLQNESWCFALRKAGRRFSFSAQDFSRFSSTASSPLLPSELTFGQFQLKAGRSWGNCCWETAQEPWLEEHLQHRAQAGTRHWPLDFGHSVPAQGVAN